jgi:hypothetical protein
VALSGNDVGAHATAPAARVGGAPDAPETGADARALTRRVLIAAISPHAGALAPLLADPSHIATVDWEWLVERAESHRVAALVASRLDRAGVMGRLPAAAHGHLDRARHIAAERAGGAARTLQQLAPLLQRNGIPFLLVKGILLADRVYGDALIRPFYDLDVIVPRTALEHAESILRTWGYQMGGIWQLLGRRPWPLHAPQVAEGIARQCYLRVFHNLSYAPPRDDRRRPVDLHWTIVPRGRLPLREEQLWARTTTARVAGVELRTLDPQATLIHQSMHALEPWFHSFRLLHLCDVAWMVDRATEPLPSLWTLAHEWGAAYHLELALRLVDRLFDVRAARTLLVGRRPSAWMREALHRIGSEQVLVDRPIADDDPWPRRAAIELGWGLAVRGLRSKLIFSLARRRATRRWQRAQRNLLIC